MPDQGELFFRQGTHQDWFCGYKLPKASVDYLWERIRAAEGSKSLNHELAGNITRSLSLEDPKGVTIDIFKIIQKDKRASERILEKINSHKRTGNGSRGEPFTPSLNNLWVNYQYKHEFNPLHDHGDLFSFVIWMKIPYELKDEHNLPFVKASNTPSASCFVFVDSAGKHCTLNIDKTYEGIVCLFPSTYSHLVYPFYTSDEARISISGNIGFDKW